MRGGAAKDSLLDPLPCELRMGGGAASDSHLDPLSYELKMR